LSRLVDPFRRLKRQYKKKKRDLMAEDIAMQSQVIPSTSTPLINISYFLEVHIYHKGLTFKSKVPPAVYEIKVHPA